VIEPGWLKIMAVQAMREDVGAVGAQLLYPDGRIQHAGVVLGVGGAAAHAHRLLYPEDEGYFRRHALPQFVSAVTAACLVVQRERFMAVNGLDETNFAVAFNDVDLCMRLNQQGWQSFYEPRAKLVHHESVSRGLDRDPKGAARLAEELAALKAAWNTDQRVDPFHHPQLGRFSERFVVRL
jgi:GT2 family glycosyltransferase